MDFDLSPAEKAFRDEFRSWLAANRPSWADGDGDQHGGDQSWLERRVAWQRRLHEAGYLGLNWPKEYGGRGATLMEQLIFSQEMIEARAPEPINVIGLGMGGPVIIHHGTEEQKRRYLDGILSADEIWCQGFSEPNAGSDLSALQTRAVDMGDHYEVTGQKVWTTLAHVSRWCLLLARERQEANPRHGLTYLIVDMQSPGVDVRSLVQITGEAEFNEVFFNQVRVPKEQILGEAGRGWEVAMTTLLHERGTLGAALASQAAITVRQLVDFVQASGRGGDQLLRQQVAQHYIESRLLQLNGYRAVTKLMKTGIPGPEGSLMKLFFSELNQRMQETAIDSMGPAGMVADGSGWQYGFLRSRANTIEAGTSEVLRNIVAERVLGLPRSR
ncbi:MAG: acyl-CoA dehydrogenase [Candidatus Nephthysia bennettiae]|uniref:Acyl-CoA dehydrogenase family protein n=1 Tax=Candidatus Nephthysia bennettiae TaxID=3127016 RepID=A0A934K7N0_9BACT|nr:acyl-CoA dehydrogenase family protein [Candidatus Dormibacteraeota bacterium]MBJ7611590.1 acyl-CoA dehydrogenase family protein [Candidatus Dormibacteraeota bacterium]PZR99373.1 MAG: acyl-CoA dehydrogenase [Candidatus Dormibacteraeota bacterium]